MSFALPRNTVRSATLVACWLTAVIAYAQSAPPPIEPPGQLVDLGGWRIHLHCSGEARATSPTIILEAGAGGFSVDWALLQPQVARMARVCSYDRAGLGWSDLGPRPRTQHQIVWELHTVLEKAAVRPPYLLVGHSYGGILVRLYTLTYPSDIVGLVLVDSGFEEGVAVLSNGRLVKSVDLATGQPIPAVKTSGPMHESDLSPALRAQIEAAARQMTPHATEPPYDRLPDDARKMRAWSFGQVKHWATNDNTFEPDELAALVAARRAKTPPFGDLPIVVLSRTPRGGDSTEEAEHTRNQQSLLSLSRRARQVIVKNSPHEIMITEPDVVAAAIQELLSVGK